jgi:Flp pilus assembly protein TadG
MNNLNLIGNEKGTTAVETAIIILPLMLLIFGIIEFGLLLYNEHVLTNAGREGARAGIVVRPDRGTGEYLTLSENVADNYSANHLVTFGSGNLNISAFCTDSGSYSCPSRGANLNVSIHYDYNFLFLSAFGIGPIPLDAVTIMRLE